jgi:hypothetical protein
MASTLTSKLLPYLSYFIYGQVILVGLVLIAGFLILIRRAMNKTPFEGDPAYAREKIAFELTSEINRLRGLRNRIHPGFEAEAEGGGAVVTAPVDTAALEAEIAKRFEDKFAAQQARIEELEKLLAEARAAGPADGASAAAGAGDGLSDEARAALERDKAALNDKVGVLEKTLLEYQIFEQDIALVKKYKAENEELRKQLSATPQVTEEDIASLFSAMTPASEREGGAPAPDMEMKMDDIVSPAAVRLTPAVAPVDATSAASQSLELSMPAIQGSPTAAPTPVPAAVPDLEKPVFATNAPVAAPEPTSNNVELTADELLASLSQGSGGDVNEIAMPSITGSAPSAPTSSSGGIEGLDQTGYGPDAPEDPAASSEADRLLAELAQSLNGGGADAPVEAPKGFVEDTVRQEPAIGAMSGNNLTAEDIEAFAESKELTSDDKLMAEFQKILGSKP